MIKLIKYLRNKKEEEKRHVLYLLTMFFGLILIIVWALAMISGSQKKFEASLRMNKDLEPFNYLGANVKAEFDIFSSNNQEIE